MPRTLPAGYREFHARGTGNNRGVVYQRPGVVEVQTIADAKLEEPNGRKANHGVIVRTLATNICGSDQHMVRGRTTAPAGLVLGHEITGEVIETGSDVLFFKKGDIVSVPFNIACGRCRNCRAGLTGICLTVNPARPGAAFGYVDMGGWIGGQADYVMVPFADFNLLRLGKDRDRAMEKIRDLALLSDILPTGFHGCVTAGVGPGSTVYVAGAGPVGLAAAVSAQLLGASCVIVGDLIPERLAQAKSIGCEIVDVSLQESVPEQIEKILGEPEVDCGVDAVGFEARGCGAQGSKSEQPASVLNAMFQVVRAGGSVGIPGLYVTDDPGAKEESAKVGALSLRLGLGWAKSQSFATGQCPVVKYHRQLMQAILFEKIQPAKAVNVKVVSIEDAPKAYEDFDKGASKKFIIDASGDTRRALGIKKSEIE